MRVKNKGSTNINRKRVKQKRPNTTKKHIQTQNSQHKQHKYWKVKMTRRAKIKLKRKNQKHKANKTTSKTKNKKLTLTIPNTTRPKNYNPEYYKGEMTLFYWKASLCIT